MKHHASLPPPSQCTWGLTSTWDVTDCTQAALALVPIVVLAVFGSVEVANLRKRKPRARNGWRGTPLRISVLVAGLLAASVQIVLAVWSGLRHAQLAVVLAEALIAGSMLFSLPLQQLAHQRSQRPSTALLFFWLLVLALGAIGLRTAIDERDYEENPARFGVTVVGLALSLVTFGLACFSPEDAPQAIKLGDGDEAYEQTEAPVVRANIFSRLTFSWMTPMMRLGKEKYITEEDLWALPREDQADKLNARFENAYRRSPGVWSALARAYGLPFLVAAALKTLQDILAFAQPQLLRLLLTFVSSYDQQTPQPLARGYTIAVVMTVCSIVQTAFLHQYFARCFETGMRTRGGLVGALFSKALRLSNSERAGRATGDIVNLMSTDATRMQDLCTYGLIAYSGVFQICIAFVSLHQLLGFYGLVGVAIMVLSLPLNAMIARLQTRLQKEQMKNKDERTRLMNEVLANIRSIKLYAWENAFAQRLFAVRNDKELVQLRKMGYLSSFSTFTWNLTPFLVAFASFACFAAFSGKTLTSDVVFPALSLFNMLSFPLAVLPNVLTSWVEAFVSAKRLHKFLSSAELQSDAVDRSEGRSSPAEGEEVLTVRDADFAWSASAGSSTLSNIDLSVKMGELVTVVGRVGCGKSSLLAAVLGEMTRTKGRVTVHGTVAYCNQSPWIMGGTVRSNITFGHRYEEAWYQTVVDACALGPDLAILPDGDSSEVGEKGLSLSGGQKARISLARAVYARADLYLLDDPLSAVDSHVAAHLFQHVLGPTGILAEKARLLCSNALAFLEPSDEIVMVRSGAIVERGNWAKVHERDSDIATLIREYGRKSEEGEDEDAEEGETKKDVPAGQNKADDPKPAENGKVSPLPEIKEKIKSEYAHAGRAAVIPIAEQKAETLRELKRSSRPKEHMSRGSVNRDIYRKFLHANGVPGFAIYLITIGLQQVLSVGTNWWLKQWSQRNNGSDHNGNLGLFLGVYAAFGFGTCLASLIGSIVLYTFCVVRAARFMHDSMYESVMRSPLGFFESTPIGTVLNRFSRDVYVIDEVLARVFGGFIRTMSQVVSVVVVISVGTPAFLIAVIPLMLVYKRIQSYYLATSRELKRLDATTKSPIFASFSELLAGVSTVRAFSQGPRFIAENEAKLDRNQAAFFASINVNRWLAVRLELIGSTIIFCAAMLAVASVASGKIDAGLTGLMMSYALSTTQSLNWVVRSATEVETNVVSVERVQEYIDLEPEAPLHRPDTKLPENWPSKGEIVFKNVNARYRPHLDLVIRDVSLAIASQEKIGVVGRTGSGKTTLASLLFRVIEIESGSITIDGIDISQVGLADLRSRLAIVPQDSQCFVGTLRQNVAPNGDATDAEIWAVLEQAHLKEHVSSMDGGLDAKIEEGGSNLSAGQRQLMCLARALLRKCSILCLDEATASVDAETDKLVQAVIRSEFANCSILTVAHRLNTILDADKIAALDAGKLIEYDSPTNLLADKSSLFSGLAKEAGVSRGGPSASGTATPSRS